MSSHILRTKFDYKQRESSLFRWFEDMKVKWAFCEMSSLSIYDFFSLSVLALFLSLSSLEKFSLVCPGLSPLEPSHKSETW